MDLGRTDTTTEERALISMFQYYRDMWPRRSHILAPPSDAARDPKVGGLLLSTCTEIYLACQILCCQLQIYAEY